MSDVVEYLVKLEAEVAYTEPPVDGQPAFRYLPGPTPILLSAPHGAIHTRNGRRKGEDEYTAGFARLVAELTGAHVIYAYRRSSTDPNWDPDAPYRKRLAKIVDEAGVRFVLDIHGAAAHRNFGIALGTIEGRSCPDHQEMIVWQFEDHGFRRANTHLDRLVVNHPRFTGGKRQDTITRFVSQNLRVPAAQFELNAHLRTVRRFVDTGDRPFHGDMRRIRRAIDAFVAVVEAMMLT